MIYSFLDERKSVNFKVIIKCKIQNEQFKFPGLAQILLTIQEYEVIPNERLITLARFDLP